MVQPCLYWLAAPGLGGKKTRGTSGRGTGLYWCYEINLEDNVGVFSFGLAAHLFPFPCVFFFALSVMCL